ncbi:Eco57I restriction-modification methylase domain-containing protein [bacterium]|nr:Eco57I restriction-modification methylase domain-containing protein [bacterium]
MINYKQEQPEVNERPTCFADRMGRLYAGSVEDKHKKKHGQYLTPVSVADFMANFASTTNKNEICLLDPGIGTSVLSSAMCEAIANKNRNVRKINIVGYEIDKTILPIAAYCLKYLEKWLVTKRIQLKYELKSTDFILENSGVLQGNQSLFEKNNSDEKKYDIIICNPPYFKIPKNDPRAKAASAVVYGQPNIYALFMAISAHLIAKDGEFIFITPRSYTAGPYFKALRQNLFSFITPLAFHLFGSRKEAFDRDSILQESIILHAKRIHHAKIENNKTVAISYSRGTKDLNRPAKRKTLFKNIINYKSLNKVIFIPVAEKEEKIISIVKSWGGSLHKFGMEISTGPIVPFRAKDYLDYEGDIKKSHAPLIWMNSVRDMEIFWPLNSKKKGQYIKICNESTPLLLPNKNYVLLRRFSAKEDKKRLNSSAYLKGKIYCDWIGLENHINYIHRPKGDIDREEALGLSAILNSRYLEVYFRASNGNTQVSATEIRDMPLPDLDKIKKIGSMITQKRVDLDTLEYMIMNN